VTCLVFLEKKSEKKTMGNLSVGFSAKDVVKRRNILQRQAKGYDNTSGYNGGGG